MPAAELSRERGAIHRPGHLIVRDQQKVVAICVRFDDRHASIRPGRELRGVSIRAVRDICGLSLNPRCPRHPRLSLVP
jgi:hypothetical protein